MPRHRRDVLTLPLFDRTSSAIDGEVAPQARDSAAPPFDAGDIARRAEGLMEEIGVALRGASLQASGWRFSFDRARTRLGCVSYERGVGRTLRAKSISISRPFSEAYGWDLMEDVMRHEIAHALDVDTRLRTDHGPKWKAWARLCGADPTRLYENEAVRLPAPYVAVCPACGDQTPYYRRPRRPGACAACCRLHNKGRYASRFRLVFYPADQVPVQQLPLFGDGAQVVFRASGGIDADSARLQTRPDAEAYSTTTRGCSSGGRPK